MPLRNLLILLFVALGCVFCYHRATRNPFATDLDQALEQIRDNYVENVSDRALFEGAMNGMVKQLDDYSQYIDPEMKRRLRESLDQEFGGIGIEVQVDPESKRLRVFSPVPGSPAYEEGVRPGDMITRIEGRDTASIPLNDAVTMLRGRPGTEVSLSFHTVDGEDREVKLARARIKIDSVLGDRRNADGTWNFALAEDPRIGYIRLTTFGEHSEEEMGRALKWINAHCEALILDLRDDPGGLLPAAEQVCDMFLDSGVIVSTRGRDRQVRRQCNATPGTLFDPDKPMAVVVNHYSASASEIVAACLQDHHRAKIVGQRTWGKGTVQNLIDMEGGKSMLKLTTASYWRPSGVNIHRKKDAKESDEWGVRPDQGFEVTLTDEQAKQVALQRRDRDVAAGKGAKPGTPAPSEPPAAKPASQPAAQIHLPDVDLLPDETSPQPVKPTGPIDDPQMRKAIQYLESELGQTGVG